MRRKKTRDKKKGNNYLQLASIEETEEPIYMCSGTYPKAITSTAESQEVDLLPVTEEFEHI